MAVAPRHGKQTRVLADGKDLSSFLRSVTVSASMDPGETTTFGSEDRSYLIGLRNATFSFDGLYAFSSSTGGAGSDPDDIVEYLDSVFASTPKTVFTVDLTRSTGGRAMLLKSDHTSYDISVPVDDVVSLAVDSQASGGYSGGKMLLPLTTVTTSTTFSAVLTPGTTTAGGTAGGVAHLHVINRTGSTQDLIFLVQHSTSGSTWATLLTFTTVSTGDDVTTFQRSTTASTVKEQLRAAVTWATTGSTQTARAAIAFSRRVKT